VVAFLFHGGLTPGRATDIDVGGPINSDLTYPDTVYVGQFQAHNVTVTQTAGTVTAQAMVLIYGNAHWIMSGGTVNLTGGPNGSYLAIGQNGVSEFVQSGGTVNAGKLLLGTGQGVTGFYTLSGVGNLNVTEVDLGNNTGANGVLTLAGGTITTSIITGNRETAVGTSAVAFNGGKLRAGATDNASWLLTNHITYYVQAGGATFDTNGHNMGIGASLVSDAANDGGLTKYGAGTLTLGTASTYNGPTSIVQGTLEATAAGSLGNSSALQMYGSTLRISGTTMQNFAGSFETDAANNVFDIATAANTFTMTGVGTGGGGLIKAGPGTLQLTGQSAYAGPTTVNAGTLALAGPNNGVGTIRGVLTINSGATVNATTVNALGYGGGQKVDVVNVSNATFGAVAAGDQGWGVTYNLDTATLASNSGVNNTTAASKFAFGNNTVVNASGGNSTISGHVDLRADNGTTNTNINVAAGTVLTIAAGMTSNNGLTPADAGFTKLGDGRLKLTAANTFTGSTVISRGFLEAVNPNALQFSTVIPNGGGLDFSTGAGTIGGLSGTVDLQISNGNSGAAAMSVGTNNTDTTYNGVLSGLGASSLTKVGTGTLTLGNLNLYTGSTVVNGGTLALNAGGGTGAIRGGLTINAGTTVLLNATNALGYNGGVKIDAVVLNGGTLSAPSSTTDDQGWGITYTLNGGLMSSNGGVSSTTTTSKFAFGNNTSVNVIAGTTTTIAGRVDLRGDVNSNTNINVGAGANLNVTAAITSTGGVTGFTKQGPGTITLTGANTYTGPTTVDPNGGTLLVNGSLSGGGTIAISAGGTLGGTGSIAGAVTDNGVLTPGASAGNIETLITGPLTMNAGATLAYEVNSSAPLASGADMVVVNGGLSLSGLVHLTINDVATVDTPFTPGTKFTLVNYSGTWNGGAFTFGSTPLAEGFEFSDGMNTWRINYAAVTEGANFTGDSTNAKFVNLTAVPEPGTTFAMLGGLALLLGQRKRRR